MRTTLTKKIASLKTIEVLLPHLLYLLIGIYFKYKTYEESNALFLV